MPTKVKFVPLTAKDRFTALQSGEVDLLSRNTTWTMSRDTTLGLELRRRRTTMTARASWCARSLKVNSALELNGASVCVQHGTTTELNLADYFRANNMKYKSVAFADADETIKAYDAGRCDAFTTDASGLYAERLQLTKPDDHVVLPEIISQGAARAGGAPGRRSVVRHRQVDALRDGRRRRTRRQPKNVDEMMKSTNPEVRRLLGVEGNFGEHSV